MNKKSFKEHIDNFPSTYSQSELIEQFTIAKNEILDFYTDIPENIFFSKPEIGWSPLENIKHLNSATSVVALFIRKELNFLLLLFGRGDSKKSIPEIIKNYNDKLNSGSGAGVFSPLFVTNNIDIEKKKSEIKSLIDSIQDLINVLPSWTEEELDGTNIVHPILGILTVREMLYFSLYHLYHHSSKLQMRLNKQ
jgi:hypothetical protein